MITLTNSFANILIMLIIIVLPRKRAYYLDIPDDDTTLRRLGCIIALWHYTIFNNNYI